jgi:hypothetical protein
MTPTTIAFLAHPAERSVIAAAAGIPCCSSCCCCTCCLHSIGGLGGAAIGSAHALALTRDRKHAAAAIGVYWFSFVGLTVLSLIICALAGQFLAWFLGVLLLAPALQLAASVVAFLFVLVVPLPNRRAAAAAVGKITLWSVTGALGGGIIMAVLLGLIALIAK